MDYRKDYYRILEVSEKATKEEIRAAFRRLAKIHHPDKNAGDLKAEEQFKLINEANEVLSNDILRHEYDEYRRIEKKYESTKQEDKKSRAASSSNKRTYTKKSAKTTEVRYYVKGKVVIKYWGKLKDEEAVSFVSELKYKIFPRSTLVTIEETEIFPIQSVPLDYLKSFKESDLFKSPISQPVNCVIKTSEGEEYFSLDLRDIRIKNINIGGVTKDNNETFGTLTGDIYAYTPKFKTEDFYEEVTECFGPTGNVEYRSEGDIKYARKEFYHSDCTTYWSEWVIISEPRKQATPRAKSTSLNTQGCGQFIWIPLIIFLIALFPKLFLGLAIIALILLLFSAVGFILPMLRIAFPFLGLLVLGLILYGAFRSFRNGESPISDNRSPGYDTLSTTKETIEDTKDTTTTGISKKDTLISHFIKWTTFPDRSYETTLRVFQSDVTSGTQNHDNMIISNWNGTLGPIYKSMAQHDFAGLNLVFESFDSLRYSNTLNEIDFARMVVSCIQSIPYYLVVDQSCNDTYDDQFITEYLANCKTECCIGYEKWGVRSPLEFLSDLKGDCDTRSLLLFTILKRYNYNVALLTSEQYRHALVAVNFSDEKDLAGLAMNINSQNYYLWETTAAGYDVGVIPWHLSNLDNWNIELLNKAK